MSFSNYHLSINIIIDRVENNVFYFLLNITVFILINANILLSNTPLKITSENTNFDFKYYIAKYISLKIIILSI